MNLKGISYITKRKSSVSAEVGLQKFNYDKSVIKKLVALNFDSLCGVGYLFNLKKIREASITAVNQEVSVSDA